MENQIIKVDDLQVGDEIIYASNGSTLFGESLKRRPSEIQSVGVEATWAQPGTKSLTRSQGVDGKIVRSGKHRFRSKSQGNEKA